MKRSNLCKTKKLMAIILAASMVMCSVSTVMAGSITASSDVKGVTDDEESEDDIDGSVTAIAQNGGDATVYVDGDVSADDDDSVPEKDIKSVTAAKADASGVNDGDISIAEINVTGDVSAKSTGDSVNVTGISASSGVHANAEVYAQNVDASSKGTQDGQNVTGINADSYFESTTYVEAEKDVTATSNPDFNKGTATGVNASSTLAGETEVNVGNDVVASSGNDAYGIKASSENNKSNTNITVGNDVSASSYGSDGVSTGINANSENGGYTYIVVNGELSSNADKSLAYGIIAGASNGGNTTIYIEKDVLAKGNTGAYGLSVSETDSDSGKGIVDIDSGDVEAISTDGTAKGIDLGFGYKNVKSIIRVYGDVEATAPVFAAGMSGGIGEGSSANVYVEGDIIAKGRESEGINIGGSAGDVDIKVDGNIIQDGESGFAVAISDSDGESDIIPDEKTHISVLVEKDIKAEDVAVAISKTVDSSKVSLTVKNEISGGKHNIVLVGESRTENLNITVWKVDTSNNKNVVENAVWDEDKEQDIYTENVDAEKQINYIIRAAAGINLSGKDYSSDGYYTEHQDNKVFLKVDIPEGHTAEFYDINGNNNYQIVHDGNGSAYLVVPKGGGVEVGVRLTKIENNKETTKNDTEEKSSNAKKSSGDHSESSKVDLYNKNIFASNFGGNPATAEKTLGLQLHVKNNSGSDILQSVSDVLTYINPLTAINNFIDTGAFFQGMQNIKGSGVVDFKKLFVDSVTDTIDVPVSASVSNGQTYKVVFSDNTSIMVTSLEDGILTIPFKKDTEGLTYIIYGTAMNPAMFIGMDVIPETLTN